MMTDHIPSAALAAFQAGGVIPAHPLALTAERKLDEARQIALSRYYLDAGVTGMAVGVHTTQFEIRDHGLFRPVLEMAAEQAREWSDTPRFMIAGAVGDTAQAVREAQVARDLGYHAVLLSLAGREGTDAELIAHCREVSQVLPLIGFYLQTSMGGPVLSEAFWRGFAEIDNVVGIKMAPFDRYRTIDVVRAVVAAGREEEITLYTGNDDHIVADLLTPFEVMRGGKPVTVRIKGGLLGHWAVWTRAAVLMMERLKALDPAAPIDPAWLALDARTTDANSAFFDAANGYQGVIAGIHEVLHRQGLLAGTWCLNPAEAMGPGQGEKISRVYADYPDLNDDAFIRENLPRWLSP
ncbi:dihydrodipicolinate synthase family protein [Alphaproteobacteria bacterium KMM 3653]|uniref:Dihydrodipicolinate synthase family protein n=1 Tax=Harenicola maris TaxID=2841044 RepID=A0AAP2GAG3_9RHOB|nr:dihydrodipicolinate synthase family protein [Harenicola maris]